VKRTTGDEPIGFAIYICMEITQGNSLCNYLYLKLAKCHAFLFIFSVISSKIGEQEGRTGSGRGVGTSGRGEVVGKGVRG
jgi:hypothetical protein